MDLFNNNFKVVPQHRVHWLYLSTNIFVYYYWKLQYKYNLSQKHIGYVEDAQVPFVNIWYTCGFVVNCKLPRIYTPIQLTARNGWMTSYTFVEDLSINICNEIFMLQHSLTFLFLYWNNESKWEHQKTGF